jgi:hypothetical protein
MFARAGYPTVFVETTGLANPTPRWSTLRKAASRIRRAGDGRPSGEQELTVYAPLALPPTCRVFRWINRELFVPRVAGDLLKIAGPAPVVVAYPPTRTTLDLISGLELSSTTARTTTSTSPARQGTSRPQNASSSGWPTSSPAPRRVYSRR